MTADSTLKALSRIFTITTPTFNLIDNQNASHADRSHDV
jgi:hypothetical protein